MKRRIPVGPRVLKYFNGLQGKGFAVVADEVSKLAENSKTAAKEIATLIKESVLKAATGNDMAEKGRDVMKNIYEKSKDVEGLVSEINSSSEEQSGKVDFVNDMVERISIASKEQASGIEQVTQAVSQLDLITQKNTSSSEETASAAEELSTQSKSLKSIVLKLEEILKGSKAGKEEGREQNSKDEQTGRYEEVLEPAPFDTRKGLERTINKVLVKPTEKIPLDDDL